MYLNNKYTKWYFNIIDNAKSRIIDEKEYFEKHHIVPKSIGGSNSQDNLVNLLPKEHFICHLLLTKMLNGINKRKMWYASYMMVVGINRVNRYKPTSRSYQIVRNNMIMASKERPGTNTGKVMSAEQKRKISDSLKGKNTQPKSEEHKQKMRKPKSEEHKKKLSESRKGKSYGYTHSEETRLKIGKSNTGKTGKFSGKEHSEETKKRMSEARKQYWENKRST
jgi:hypothetical protein